MTGVITSIPPLVEQPPGNNSSNPAGLPGVTYTAAIPNLPQTWTGVQTFNAGTIVLSGTGGTSQVLRQSTLNGPVTVGQLSYTDISGGVPPSVIPTPTTTTLGGVFSKASVANNFLTQIGTDGVIAAAQPAFTNISGSVAASQMPALTGDVTTTAGTVATTIGATKVTSAMLNADVFSTAHTWAGQQTFVAPILGTPASGTATNLTGTAAGLTAGTVTTNANLTGPVTSAGNATTIGANQVSRANLAQGVARSVVGVTGNATANVADIQGTANQALVVNSAGTALAFGAVNLASSAGATGVLQAASFPALTGDVTTVAGALASTIAANAVTNAKMATMAAYTIKANATGSSAVPTDVSIPALTQKASPVAADKIMIADSAASDQLKYATVSSLASAGSVSSIAGNTGAFTLTYPISNSTNAIVYAGPTNSGQLTFTSTAALAFKPYNGDTIKINGVVLQIPSGGIAGLGAPTSVFLNGVAAQTLVANTAYYIYAFSNAGTITADFRTGAHSPSATAGNVGTEILTGDDSRSLIGQVKTGATVVYLSDIATNSWFNRRNKTAALGTTSATLPGGATPTPLSFMTWGDEAVMASCPAHGGQNANATANSRINVDGSPVGSPVSGDNAAGVISDVAFSNSWMGVLGEGSHTAGPTFGGSAGTATYYFTVLLRG